MAKPDFYITGIHRDPEDGYIDYVLVQPSSELQLEMVVDSMFVAWLIDVHQIKFETAKIIKERLRRGQPVHVFEDIYLRTDQNNNEWDNLENLKEFELPL